MKYYAITVNPLNVTRPKEDLDKALSTWLKITGCNLYIKVYELAGKKLHIHATVSRKSKPYLRRAKVYGYQIYFGGETTPKWYDYISKQKIIENEAIATHYFQNNYAFTNKKSTIVNNINSVIDAPLTPPRGESIERCDISNALDYGILPIEI